MKNQQIANRDHYYSKITRHLWKLAPSVNPNELGPPPTMFKGTMDMLLRMRDHFARVDGYVDRGEISRDEADKMMKPYCETILMVLDFNCREMRQGINSGEVTDDKTVKKLE